MNWSQRVRLVSTTIDGRDREKVIDRHIEALRNQQQFTSDTEGSPSAKFAATRTAKRRGSAGWAEGTR
jgi:hypothetical protein